MTKNSRTLRICVVGTRGLPNVPGGVEKHCECLYPLLAKDGLEIIVFARRPYVAPEEYTYKGVRVIPLKSIKNKFLEAFHHTLMAILAARKYHPDICHFHAVGPSLLVPLAKLMGFKVVMTHHGPDYMRKKWNVLAKFILKMGESFGCKNADEVICISKGIIEQVKSKYKRTGTLIPNGVIIPQLTAQDDALKSLGLKKGKYVLAVGRFVPEKGFHDLIVAFETADLKGWKLVIAGDADHEDDYSRQLKKQASKLENAVLPGFLTGKNLQELYTHAGLFVLPSYYEGLPIVLLEALSYGLCCIMSDIPPNLEVDQPKERYFKLGDVRELAEKINHWSSRPFSEQEKANQIDKISRDYDWAKIAHSTFEVYERIAK